MDAERMDLMRTCMLILLRPAIIKGAGVENGALSYPELSYE